jgi:hypothetical protein
MPQAIGFGAVRTCGDELHANVLIPMRCPTIGDYRPRTQIGDAHAIWPSFCTTRT